MIKNQEFLSCYKLVRKTDHALTNGCHHTQVGGHYIRGIKSTTHSHFQHHHVTLHALEVQTCHDEGNFKKGCRNFMLGAKSYNCFE